MSDELPVGSREEWVRTSLWKVKTEDARYELAQTVDDAAELDRLMVIHAECRREHYENPTLAALLNHTVSFVRRFVVFDAVAADAVALWNAHTYVYDCAPASPYLHPYSPEPGSGKTTLLDVLELTARNAVQADNLTEAVLYRMIDKKHPTLLFDEVDAVFSKKNSDSTEGIRQVLNSGYRRNKKVWRCVPPSHDVAAFDVYCPKATAGLNELPPTLAHRSIPISLQPPRPGVDVYEELDVEEAGDEAERLRSNLQAWADEARGALSDRRLKPPKLSGLDARGNEIWRILFRIAYLAGGGWPERARAAALELSGGTRRHQDASAAVKLLGHIRDIFNGERMPCGTLVDALNADDELPYGGWRDGKGISTRELGKKLGPYGVYAKTIRIGDYRGNGYEREQFEDPWSRYLPAFGLLDRDTVTTGMVEPNLDEIQPGQTVLVTVSENGANPHEQSDVTVVTVSETLSGLFDDADSIELGEGADDGRVDWADFDPATASASESEDTPF